MPSLIITFEGRGRIRLSLKKDKRQEADAESFTFDGTLDNLLIEAIDKFLKRNRIAPSSLHTVIVRKSLDKSTVALNVASACASALRWRIRQ